MYCAPKVSCLTFGVQYNVYFETAFLMFANKNGQALTLLSQNLPVSLIFCISGNQVKRCLSPYIYPSRIERFCHHDIRFMRFRGWT